MTVAEELKIILSAQNQTTKAFGDINKSLEGLKSTVLKVAAAVGVALSFKSVVDDTAKWAQETKNLSNELGINAKQASTLNFIGQSLGITNDELVSSFGRLSKNMFGLNLENEKSVDVFEKWGIAVKGARGETKNIIDVLSLTSDRVRELGDGAAARALEMDVFGKAGGRLHDLLMEGSDGVKELSKSAEDLGLVLDDTTEAGLFGFIRAQQQFGLAIQGLKVQLGTALLPILSDVLTGFVKWVKEIMPAVRDQIIPLIREIGALVGAFFGFVAAVWKAIGAVITAIFHVRALDGFAKSLGEALRRVTGLFKELAQAVDKFRSDISEKGLLGALADLAGTIKDKILKILGDLGEKLDSMGPAGEIAKDALIALGAITVINAILGTVTKVLDLVEAVKKLPAKTLLVIDVVLIGLAIEEVAKTVQLVADNWELARKKAHDGQLEMQGDSNDLGRLTLKRSVEWGDFFDRIGTRINDIKVAWETFFTWVGAVSQLAFATVGLAIVGAVNSGIAALNNLIAGFNSLPGVNGRIPLVAKVDVQALTAQAEAALNTLARLRTATITVNVTGGVNSRTICEAEGGQWIGGQCVFAGSTGGGGGGGGGGSGGGGGGSNPDAGAAACEARPWNGAPGTTGHYQWNWVNHDCFPVWDTQTGNGRPTATGGIFTRPTNALIGEAGPEAVIPLSRAGDVGLGTTINLTVNVTGNIAESESALADMVGKRIVQQLASFRGLAF